MPSTILLGLGGSSGGCRAAVETSVISIEGLIWRPRGFPRGIEEAKREMERWGEVLTKTGRPTEAGVPGEGVNECELVLTSGGALV